MFLQTFLLPRGALVWAHLPPPLVSLWGQRPMEEVSTEAQVQTGGPCLGSVTVQWLPVSTPDVTTGLSVTQLASKTSL